MYGDWALCNAGDKLALCIGARPAPAWPPTAFSGILESGTGGERTAPAKAPRGALKLYPPPLPDATLFCAVCAVARFVALPRVCSPAGA